MHSTHYHIINTHITHYKEIIVVRVLTESVRRMFITFSSTLYMNTPCTSNITITLYIAYTIKDDK